MGRCSCSRRCQWRRILSCSRSGYSGTSGSGRSLALLAFSMHEKCHCARMSLSSFFTELCQPTTPFPSRLNVLQRTAASVAHRKQRFMEQVGSNLIYFFLMAHAHLVTSFVFLCRKEECNSTPHRSLWTCSPCSLANTHTPASWYWTRSLAPAPRSRRPNSPAAEQSASRWTMSIAGGRKRGWTAQNCP